MGRTRLRGMLVVGTAVVAVAGTGVQVMAHDYATTASFPAGGDAFDDVLVDVDGDGDLDVVTVNIRDETVSVLRGDGLGGLAPPETYDVSTSPTLSELVSSVAAADLDGDGDPDLAVTLPFGLGRLRLLENDGTGTYTVGAALETGSPSAPELPGSVTAGDLDGDSDVDLVVAHEATDDVAVLLNQGSMVFDPPVLYAMGDGISDRLSDVELADVDGDGALDVLGSNDNFGSGTVDGLGVRLGAGDGTFGPRITTDTGFGRPFSLEVADLDGDGHLDVVVANRNQGHLQALLGDGTGAFTVAWTFLTARHVSEAVVVDLDGDGILDLAAVVDDEAFLWVVHGNGDGTFADAEVLPAEAEAFPTGAGPNGIAAGDVDGDGLVDLVTANTDDGSVTVLREAILDPDSDGDGLPDSQDPDVVADVVAGLPDSALAARGHRTALLSILDSIEADIAAGDIEDALTRLRNLRRHLDGCDPAGPPPVAADGNDWITTCPEQDLVRDLVDGIITALGG